MKIFTWQQRFVTWGVTVTSILVFVGIGLLLDMLFGTKPLFVIFGLLISFPVNVAMLKRQIFKQMKSS